MGLWTRSQDKKNLTEASTFRICEGFRGGKIAHYTIDTDVQYNEFSIELGEYSTEEKALKVVDMIQKAITNQLCDISRIVFLMPQDDEVEA